MAAAASTGRSPSGREWTSRASKKCSSCWSRPPGRRAARTPGEDGGRRHCGGGGPGAPDDAVGVDGWRHTRGEPGPRRRRLPRPGLRPGHRDAGRDDRRTGAGRPGRGAGRPRRGGADDYRVRGGRPGRAGQPVEQGAAAGDVRGGDLRPRADVRGAARDDRRTAVRAAVFGDAGPGARERPGRHHRLFDCGARAGGGATAAHEPRNIRQETVLTMATTLLPDDRRSLTIRLSVLQYLTAVVFAALAVGVLIFQIAQHQKFLETAENNRVRKLPLPAPRGGLLDRDGRMLVENQVTLNIALVREQTKNLSDVLRHLAAATGVSEAQLRDTVNRRRREPTYHPMVLIENASREQVIAASARRLELPGIIYQEVPSRRYPASDMAAHLFGYVGEVTEAQLQRPDYDGIEPGTMVGQAGVELAYNKNLMGTEGNKTGAVNSVGPESRELSN